MNIKQRRIGKIEGKVFDENISRIRVKVLLLCLLHERLLTQSYRIEHKPEIEGEKK